MSKATPPVVEFNENLTKLELVKDGTNYDGSPSNARVVNSVSPLPPSIVANDGEELITVFVMTTQGNQTHVTVVSSPVDNTIYTKHATVKGYNANDVSTAVNKLIREIESER